MVRDMSEITVADQNISSVETKLAPPLLSVVVPMYNEEQIILKNVQSLSEGLESLKVPWEIVLVNDGSTDNTLTVLMTERERFPKLRVVSYPVNRGRGYALRKGFQVARGKFIVTTEADLTWGVETVLKLFQRLQHLDEDIVVASPYRRGGKLEQVPFKRALLSRLGNRILGLTFSGKVTMVSGMTRGYRREVVEAMDLESDGKEIHLEILSKASALGFRIGEIPAILRWERGKSGKWKGLQRHTGKLIASHLLFSFGEFPFLLFGSVGLLFLFMGTSMGIGAYFLSLSGIQMGGRPLMMASMLLILFGLQLIVFCFLANQNRDLRNALIRLNSRLLEFTKEKNRTKDVRED